MIQILVWNASRLVAIRSMEMSLAPDSVSENGRSGSAMSSEVVRFVRFIAQPANQTLRLDARQGGPVDKERGFQFRVLATLFPIIRSLTPWARVWGCLCVGCVEGM